MNFKELLEGAEPKMPGAPSGIKIMTPQQFVASAGEMPTDSDDIRNLVYRPELYKKVRFTQKMKEEGVAEGSGDSQITPGMKTDYGTVVKVNGNTVTVKASNGELTTMNIHDIQQGVAEGSLNEFAQGSGGGESGRWYTDDEMTDIVGDGWWQDMDVSGANIGVIDSEVPKEYMIQQAQAWLDDQGYSVQVLNCKVNDDDMEWYIEGSFQNSGFAKKGVAEGQEHLDRIRKLSGLGEATKLPASTRDLKGQEFQDYMKRIVGTPDVDKAGNVKVDKKGNEKYVSGKTKGDKYKMPYIHRSSVVTYMSPDGQTFDEDAVKKTLAIRPKALLKQNEKMKHSNGEFEQFFNVGFAALVGLALDEQTNNLIVVNTCPGAGSCKIDCFAMKGGKIQFQGPWQSDGRILTYLLNDPDGFFNQLSSEISKEASAGAKGDKKFPNGWQTTIRWHDAGDFFSPEYLDMALKMAAKHPDVRFYAYTKMAGAALAKKPDNFIINWSEGANTEQEKQIKAQDPNLDTTKNSRIVPEKLFYDLLAKDEKGNLKKTADGAWQPASPDALAQIKQRIAKEYGISSNSILSYDEYNDKVVSKQWKEWLKTNGTSIEELRMLPDYEKQLAMYRNRFLIDKKNGKVQQVTPLKYNIIVAPGEGDISANDPSVLSTLLLRH